MIKGNTFGGTAFASYGAFWMGWFLLEYLTWTDKALYAGVQSGKSLWCGLWAVLTFGFFIVTCRKNGCLMTIFRWVRLGVGCIHATISKHQAQARRSFRGAFPAQCECECAR